MTLWSLIPSFLRRRTEDCTVRSLRPSIGTQPTEHGHSIRWFQSTRHGLPGQHGGGTTSGSSEVRSRGAPRAIDQSRSMDIVWSERGYTVAESAVALALLLTVLVPAVGTLTYLVTQKRTEHRMEALVFARHEMEQTLAAERFEPAVRQDGAWRTVRDIDSQDGLVVITLSVYRAPRGDATGESAGGEGVRARAPLVVLRTARQEKGEPLGASP